MIVILGSPNGPHGELLDRALERLGKGVEESRLHPHYLIACTGGIGPSNPTNKPHAYYAAHYLIKQGVPKERILEPVESKNTVEDAHLLEPHLKKYQPKELILVTSDYHMPRARFIFDYLYPHIPLICSIAESIMPQEEYEKLMAAEEKKLHWHQLHGVIL